MSAVRKVIRWGGLVPFLVLAALPLVLLAMNDQWIWDSTAFFDNHVYVGFFRHYLEFNYPFVENYKSSRLPFLFPGVLLYRFFSADFAHHALFLFFLIGEGFLLYSWARRRFGEHAAFVTAAAQLVFAYSHTGPSYHTPAASAYLVAALYLLDSPARMRSWVRAMLAGGVFAAAVTTNTLVAGLTPVFGIYALMAIPRPWSLGAIIKNALASLLGAILAITLLGLINRALGGPLLFFMEQLKASMSYANTRAPHAFKWSELLPARGYLWLVFPFFMTAVSMGILAVRIRIRRLDQAAVAAAGLLISMCVATALHFRGLGLLEHQHLFQPFFVPVFFALAAALAAVGPGIKFGVRSPLGAFFLIASAIVVIAPLSLLGGSFSRAIMWVGQRYTVADCGPILALIVLVVAAVVIVFQRRSTPRLAFVALLAFGIFNPLNAPKSQPAYLYDVREQCSFRGDFFSALVEADPIFSTFDPNNQAHWSTPGVRFDQPRYDGRGWCRQLPIDTVARDIPLTHYFFTTAQFTNGFKMPPLRKLVITGTTREQVAAQLQSFRRRRSPNLQIAENFAVVIRRRTFSVYIHGYDISEAAPAKQ